MQRITREKHTYTEADILAAITAYKSKEFTSIRACANAFSIPFATFHTRVFGTTSRSHAKEPMRILSVPEKKTLVRWISHLHSVQILDLSLPSVTLWCELKGHIVWAHFFSFRACHHMCCQSLEEGTSTAHRRKHPLSGNIDPRSECS